MFGIFEHRVLNPLHPIFQGSTVVFCSPQPSYGSAPGGYPEESRTDIAFRLARNRCLHGDGARRTRVFVTGDGIFTVDARHGVSPRLGQAAADREASQLLSERRPRSGTAGAVEGTYQPVLLQLAELLCIRSTYNIVMKSGKRKIEPGSDRRIWSAASRPSTTGRTRCISVRQNSAPVGGGEFAGRHRGAGEGTPICTTSASM